MVDEYELGTGDDVNVSISPGGKRGTASLCHEYKRT